MQTSEDRAGRDSHGGGVDLLHMAHARLLNSLQEGRGGGGAHIRILHRVDMGPAHSHNARRGSAAWACWNDCGMQNDCGVQAWQVCWGAADRRMSDGPIGRVVENGGGVG